MTSPSTRPTSSRTAPARRTTLLAASALCGVATMLAQPALAQTLPGIPSAANITVSTGGSQPAITAPNANTLDIDLNAPRTVINWASLHVSGADAMTFHFDANSDIVLNKTTSQIAIDAGGTVSGLVGASAGGNIWFYSPQGVIVSPGAVMTGGGFLFSRGTGIVDAGFVDAADPLANLRAATNALIRINSITSATSASIDASGNVLLSASSGALNVGTAAGTTVDISTTSGSITASEVTATSGAASVTAGGPGATVSAITGATGVTVSSDSNTSVGSATTTTSGDIVLGSGGSVSLTLGNSARDTLLTAPLIFLSTLDAGRDAILTGDTGVTVTNRIFAGDDIELTASNGDITAGGAFLRSTGAGAADDAHILLRSDTGSVTATNTLQTQGTGARAGDITIQAATTASAGSTTATRDIKITGVTASLTSGSAARDIFVTATTGGVTVTTLATAGDDVEITATTGAVSAGAATLRSTGVGAADDAHVLARSTASTVSVGTAQTQGTGAAAGDVIISANTTATLGSGSSSRDLTISGVAASLTTGAAARDLFVTSTTGDATVVTSATAGDDLEITATIGDVVAGGATLRSTGVGASNDAHILLTANNGSVDFGTAITEGTGVALGKVTADAAGTITGTAAQASLDVSITGAGSIDLGSATAGRFITVSSTGGGATLGAAEMTGTGTGHNLLVSGSGDAILGAPDFSSITTANTFSRTGGNTGTATVRSTTGDAKVYLDTSATIDTLEGEGVDVTISSGPASFGTITANTNDIYVEALDGALTVGAATAANGDVELYSGGGDDLTITGAVHASGLVDIESDGLLHLTATSAVTSDDEIVLGGDTVTIAGSVHGDGPVQIGAGGLVDGTAATLISSGDDLTILGGTVDVGTLEADGIIGVVASDGDADVQSAHAGVAVTVAAFTANVFVGSAEADDQGVAVQAAGNAVVDLAKVNGANGVIVVQADGDATLRAGEAALGILVEATDTGTATFGADTAALITNANYALTGPSSGCGCSPAPDGLQVYSAFGDAVVNAYSVSNPIVLVASGEFNNATVTLQTGDLKIDELAGYNITLEAQAGTLETGAAFSGGGDYTVTAQDFLGDVLTPTLTTGLIHDVTITDTLGDLNLGTAAIHADRRLTIVAQDGAVTGAAQLSAGSGLNDGRVVVTGEGVALDTITSDGLVTLDGGNGLVDVATSLDVWGNYTLRGGDFANAALRPQGSMLGTWNISDQIGGFDFSGKTLHYGGAVLLFVHGVVNGGDITVDAGNIYAEVDSGHLGTLTAPMFVGATSVEGGIDVDLIRAGTTARVWATDFGTAHLGAAIMTGTGAPQVLVKAFGGDAILGAATPGAITAANVVTSTGATSTVDVTGATGRVDVNLDHVTNATLTTVEASNAVNIKVVNGTLAISGVTSTNGAVTINGPTGLLTVDQLTAHSTSRINAIGDMRLVAADADAQLTLQSLAGGVRLGDGTPGRLIDVGGGLTLQAFTDIVQEQGALKADTLTVAARSGVTLLGDNLIPNLLSVTVSNGGFAYHGTSAFIVQGVVDVQHGTVDLRSDGTIGQNLAGVILAQKLTGSSVGAANFRAANEIVELGDFTNTGGLFKLVDNRALTVSGTVLSTGTLSIASHGGMTIAGTGTVRANGAGDAVVLASDGVFTNARGADAVTAASAGGRWLIYTQAFGDPQGSTAGNTFNGLSGKSYYGTAYDFAASGFTAGVNNGNRFVYAYQPTITVTPDSKIVTYDGAIPSLSATVTGLVNGDLFTDAWTGALVINGATSKNVGAYTLTAVTSGLTSELNYAFAAGTPGSLRIDPKALNGVLAANDKTYDGATTATGSVSLTGVVTGDTVTASGTYAFADKNAGTGKTVTASGVTLAGADAGNYTLASTATDTADIAKKGLTGALTANNKTYDGTTTATGSIGLTGVLAGETVTASGAYAFADRNAGTGKTVTASGAVLAGADAGNYSLTGVSAALADILRRSVTVAADSVFKAFGQVDPTLSYRLTVGDLAAGDAFTGALARAGGEIPGGYAITRGTLALSANYDVTFTGAVFTIRPVPSNAQGGSPALKHLNEGPDFTLDWDPEPNLTTEGQTGGQTGGQSGGALTVAALR
jgi:hypothetical protein